VWDYIVDDDLKELIGTTYTDKMDLIFGSSSLKNFTVKCTWLQAIVGWVSFWEVSQKTCK